MLLLGGALGGALFGLYLFVGNNFGFHRNDVWAAQAIPDFKSFLRIHLDHEGALTIYALGVRRVCRSWSFQPKATHGEAWFAPANGGIPIEVIERITVEPVKKEQSVVQDACV